MNTSPFSEEPTPSSKASEYSIAERAQQLQEERNATSDGLRELMQTIQYAFAMSSTEAKCLPPESQKVRDRADAMEKRCRDIRQEIKDLFDA